MALIGANSMSKEKPRPTVDELFQLLKRTSLPTVLVEGADDIVFYRKIEEDLVDLGLDILPAGNKDCVLELMSRLQEECKGKKFAFVVDKDLWVHAIPTEYNDCQRLVMTDGYSVENDLFLDGELEELLSVDEKTEFLNDIERFLHWYALEVSRRLNGKDGAFRTHPGKVLDDPEFFNSRVELNEGEEYPNVLKQEIKNDFRKILRGKSLLSILHRQLSKSGRDVKFSGKQLMAFGGTRKGENYKRLRELIKQAIIK